MIDHSLYLASNDVVTIKISDDVSNVNSAFLGIANLHFLHILSSLILKDKVECAVAIDISYKQISYLQKIVSIIICSASRTDFVESYFNIVLSPELKNKIKSINSDLHVVRGDTHDGYFELEKEFWSNVEVNCANFADRFEIDKCEQTSVGLKISNFTIGQFSEYFLTLFTGNSKPYDKNVFPIGFGAGFLANETQFHALKKFLENNEISFIKNDISFVLLDLLQKEYRYFKNYVWVSNIFNSFFMDMHPNLRYLHRELINLGNQSGNFYPEIDINLFYDERVRMKGIKALSPVITRTFSAHSLSFRSLLCVLDRNERVLEVVNQRQWIIEDNGASKIVFANYCMVEQLSHADYLDYFSQNYDSVFLHVLVGHGFKQTKYFSLINMLKSYFSCIVLLEHNRNSSEFSNMPEKAISLDELRHNCGQEKLSLMCPGQHSVDRNIIVKY